MTRVRGDTDAAPKRTDAPRLRKDALMPLDPDTIDDQIAESAAQPAEVEVDGQKVRQHSIKDQIALAKYANQATSNGRGFRVTKLRPSGSTTP